MAGPTVLIVPGLRDHVAQHWQTLLEQTLRDAGRPVQALVPMGRADLDCALRVAQIDAAVQATPGPVVIVAHSGGCITVAHWATHSATRSAAHSATRSATHSAARHGRGILGALLAVPPDFEQPMPDGYPSLDALRAAGWLPVPRARLPFRSIVAASRDDPLASYDRVAELARDWGGELVDLGDVGHLNPASGFGPWPRAIEFVDQLSQPHAAAVG